mmetsp:Transcript_5122/g.10840  ORF Transcript_5122/g.10840 Transcript_5122/m.10840 type:complete len:643 (-) Transcript_5122:214-2142(-)
MTEDSPPQTNLPSPEFWLTIVSASYGPCEKHLINNNSEQNIISLTRDVTSLLRALILVQQQSRRFRPKKLNDDAQHQHPKKKAKTRSEDSNPKKEDGCHHRGRIRVNAMGPGGMKRSQIVVLGNGTKSMNEVFGDPCPGISKRLHVSYVLADAHVQQQDSLLARAATAEVHHSIFAEHEPVVFRKKRITPSGDQTTRTTSRDCSSLHGMNKVVPLSSETSEIVLPIVMPYLELRERVNCRSVCMVWKDIIKDWGVSASIDSSDAAFPSFTRPFFRGLLSHSHSGLHSLFLSGFRQLTKSDLHPNIPHLRKLHTLDVSHCVELDNSTLELLSVNCKNSLQVLYMKGLRRITDDGILHIASCKLLKVLDVSNIGLTDRSGVPLGENLRFLKAIYMRDNFRLTNETVNSITKNCKELEQLTLWGCIGLNEIRLPDIQVNHPSIVYIAVVNLWGCHNLNDNAANSFEGMDNLRSLVVSECHRLTDTFVVSFQHLLSCDFLYTLTPLLKSTICRLVPWLHHFQLRYCKKITDIAIQAISHSMNRLYSLDLSFCTNLSASAISELLHLRAGSLFELRLLHCHQLDICVASQSNVRNDRAEHLGTAARLILKALRSNNGDGCQLCVLDARHCTGGQPVKATAGSVRKRE